MSILVPVAWFCSSEQRRRAARCCSVLALLGCSGVDDAPPADGPTLPSVAPTDDAVVGVPGATAGPGGDASMPGQPSGSAPEPGSEPPPGAGVPDADPTTPASSSPAPVMPPAVAAFEPAPAMLRRLTRAQFRNAVRDVFGVEIDAAELDQDSWDGHFAAIGAASVVTSERGVEQYHAAIETAVDHVFSDPTRGQEFVGCELSGQVGDTCLRGYVEALGRRAWRRPLDAAERDLIESVAFDTGVELGSAVEGARWATVALFTSPNFLYRSELGAPDADGEYRLTGYEMASRLAFLIWNSLPDDQLLDDAANGLLEAPDGIRAAAERLLDAPAGREVVGAFAEQFMRLDRIGTQAKDANLFPAYGAALQAAMVRDMREVWQILAFDQQQNVRDLFTTSTVFVNRDLAEVYGLDIASLDSTTFEVRSLPAGGPRVGILGKAGFLSQFANQKEGSPTLRGKFIRESLMCTKVPPPPGDVTTMLEETVTDEPMTKRDRLKAHSTEPSCELCHALTDPLGLPFETFDAIGSFRTTEAGLDIDPSGEFDGQPVADARAMSAAIGASDQVAECLTRRFYTYAVGHKERDVDASVINELQAEFESADFNMRELVLAIATHRAFSAVVPQL